MCNIFLDLFPAIFTERIGKASSPHPLTRYFAQLTTQVVRCPLPGKYPLMQAWRLLAGRIAQRSFPNAGLSASGKLFYLIQFSSNYYFIYPMNTFPLLSVCFSNVLMPVVWDPPSSGSIYVISVVVYPVSRTAWSESTSAITGHPLLIT